MCTGGTKTTSRHAGMVGQTRNGSLHDLDDLVIGETPAWLVLFKKFATAPGEHHHRRQSCLSTPILYFAYLLLSLYRLIAFSCYCYILLHSGVVLLLFKTLIIPTSN